MLIKIYFNKQQNKCCLLLKSIKILITNYIIVTYTIDDVKGKMGYLNPGKT